MSSSNLSSLFRTRNKPVDPANVSCRLFYIAHCRDYLDIEQNGLIYEPNSKGIILFSDVDSARENNRDIQEEMMYIVCIDTRKLLKDKPKSKFYFFNNGEWRYNDSIEPKYFRD